MKTVCLKVNVSSAKTNIILDGAIIAKLKFIVLSCKEIEYFSLILAGWRAQLVKCR